MESFTEAADRRRDRTAQARDTLDATRSGPDRLDLDIQKNPMRALLVTAGAGLLVGLVLALLRSRRSSD